MKYFWLVLLFIVPLKAEEGTLYSAETFVFSSTMTVSSKDWNVSTYTWGHSDEESLTHDDLIDVYSAEHKVIFRIDKDGDIFLRGKWIGKDERLPDIFRRAYQ